MKLVNILPMQEGFLRISCVLDPRWLLGPRTARELAKALIEAAEEVERDGY